MKTHTIILLSIILIGSLSNSYAVENRGKKNMTTTNNTFWTIDYAVRKMEDTANISYGLTNQTNFNEIIAQKNKGDPNALYVYAYLLAYYNVMYERVNLSAEDARLEALKIFWALSKKDHPQACDAIIRFGNKEIQTRINLSEQKVTEQQLKCVQVATKNKLENFARYGDILLFESNADNSYYLSLKGIKQKNKDTILEAITQYEKGAMKGDIYCLTRITAAYYEGIGVKQDKIKAAAWAKITTERTVNIASFEPFDYAYKINDKLGHDEQIQQSEAFQTLYTELQKIPKL